MEYFILFVVLFGLLLLMLLFGVRNHVLNSYRLLSNQQLIMLYNRWRWTGKQNYGCISRANFTDYKFAYGLFACFANKLIDYDYRSERRRRLYVHSASSCISLSAVIHCAGAAHTYAVTLQARSATVSFWSVGRRMKRAKQKRYAEFA